MGGLIVFGKVLYRDYDLLASTSFACAALLIYEPFYIYNAGFQLSFGAVFGIAVLTAPVERALTLAATKLRIKKLTSINSLASCVAATAATTPLLLYHFQVVSVYAILINMIIIPTASVLVVFGLLTGLAGLIWLPAASFLAGVSFYMLKFYDALCAFFNDLPFSVLQTKQVSVFICLLMYCVIGCFAVRLSRFKDY